MMLPQDWERVAAERTRDWEKEMHNRQLLAQLPQQPPIWQRWTGNGMVWVGTWLMRWGERMTRHECQKSVSMAS